MLDQYVATPNCLNFFSQPDRKKTSEQIVENCIEIDPLEAEHELTSQLRIQLFFSFFQPNRMRNYSLNCLVSQVF